MSESGRGALDAVLGLHLRLAHGASQRRFADHFATLALTQKQVAVLWLVGDRPGIAQVELAGALQMDRATMMTIVHALERRQALARASVPDDARKLAYTLTPGGADLLARARETVATHEAWLTARYTEAEVATLTDLLRRIHEEPQP